MSSAIDKESIKQHVMDLLGSFSHHENHQIPVTPSPEYLEAVASAVSEKIRALIPSSSSQLSSTLSSSIPCPVVDCPVCDELKTKEVQNSAGFGVKPSNSELESMKDVGWRSGTDKVKHHGYHRFYPLFLEPLRQMNLNSPIRMLEIGYLHGESFKMWLEYFKGAGNCVDLS